MRAPGDVNDQRSLLASDCQNVLRRYESQVADAEMARVTRELFSADAEWFRDALAGPCCGRLRALMMPFGAVGA